MTDKELLRSCLVGDVEEYHKIKAEPSQSFSVPPANPKFSLLDKQKLVKSLNPKERISFNVTITFRLK
jgi:hypothetical protein